MRQDDVTSVEPTLATPAIRQAGSARDYEDARRLFREYADWLKVDLCFQDFERELATLPGAYAPPRGRLLLVGDPGEAFGCISLRPLDPVGLDSDKGGKGARLDFRRHGNPADGLAEIEPGPFSASDLCGEVKRLYVQPRRRGERWGERLACELLQEAKTIGYRELKLDTFAWMSEARALYARLGFRECAPYYGNPHDGVVYMSLTLRDAERPSASENIP
jgi:ribosomal protein S18 acetylase RimI-like enzyme